MSVKRFLGALAALVLLTFLSSCSGTTQPAAATPPLPFRITWTDYSGRGQAIQKIVDGYNETSPDGSVIQMAGGDEDFAAIESLLAQNTETIYVLPYRYVQFFGARGDLMDLSEAFADAEPWFYPEIWALGSMDGAAYGIPWLGHSMCLLYNKTLLERAGVDPDGIDSLDALVSALDAVEQSTGARGIGLVGAESNDVSWMVNQFIYGFGGSLVDPGAAAVAVNSPQAKEALTFYRDVLGSHAQPTWTEDTGAEVMKYFREQAVAFEIQGIWGITDILKNGATFEVGVISMSDIGLRAEVGPMMLAVPESMNTAGKEQAVRFIAYMISKEAQEQILNCEYSPEHDTYYPFRTPIRIDMADTQILQSNPEYLKFIEGFEYPSIDVPIPAWQTVKSQWYEPGLHQVMKGEISIDAFLELVEAEGNQILESQQGS